MIHYLKNSEIDFEKWDACVAQATNSLIYGYAFYLNAMSENWDALVFGNYEAVMPLVWRKKKGIKYLYQPAFTQQLGIFSITAPDRTMGNLFLEALKKKFCFAEIFTNIKCREALPNYILPLTNSYTEISKNYSGDLVKNLKKSQKYSLQYITLHTPSDAINEYRQMYAQRLEKVSENDYENFLGLCNYCKTVNKAFVRSVNGPDKELLAIGLFLKDDKRIYNVMSTTTEAGRKRSANHWLFDNIIREFAGTKLILDFEGSIVPGIQKFYSNY